MTSTIRFMKHYVTDGVTKARVHYSAGRIIGDNRQAVTLYAKDYGLSLASIFGTKVQDDTDIMTDYFDKGRVRFFEGDEHYAAALARCSNS